MVGSVTRSRRVAIWAIAGVGAAAGIAIVVVESPRIGRVDSLSGAVLIADTDPRKQLPLANVAITGETGDVTVRTFSDPTGFFRLRWPARQWLGQSLTLRFSHPDYQNLVINDTVTRQIYIARLMPSHALQGAEPDAQETPLTNLRIRYSIRSPKTFDVGSTARTFEVVNTGNVPCREHRVCSPDGRWAAAMGSFQLDAGAGQEFQNARVSCIGGPCPFTRIETDDFSHGGRRISCKVRVWSDTVTFLVEAEVLRTAISDIIRQSYPSIFGRTMTFTLPPDGLGPSIQADVDGTEIVFPLGPALILSWASCSVQSGSDHSTLYRCALKPGYRFR